jgi:hypothetical protein
MTSRAPLLLIAALALAACTREAPSVHAATPRPAQASTGALLRSDTVSCVESYTPRAAVRLAFAFDGTVESVAAARTNRTGKGYLDLVAVTFTVNEWFAGGSGASVTVDMPPPNNIWTSDEAGPSYGLGSRLLVSGQPRWGGKALEDALAWGCGFSRHYDPRTATSWRTAASA